MSAWMKRGLKAAVVLAVLIVAALGIAALRWRTATNDLRDRLMAEARPPAPPLYSSAQTADIPEPARRYFAAALPEGQPFVTRALIAWTGEFNMGQPGSDRWVRFTAEQDFVPGAPGMVWDARMAMPPGLTVRVRDSYVQGVGSMRAAVFGAVTIVDRSGSTAMAVASLQRYLAEATWLPTALLPSQGVRWTAIDDHRALATLAAGGVSASVEFRFGPDGLPASIYVPDRLFDDGRSAPSPQPWQGRNLRFTEFHGMKVPEESVVEWLLPTGTFAYWRGRPASIDFEYAR